jgi:hypothetical protein
LIKETKNKIIGIILLIVNLTWTGHWIWLFYGYYFTGILWLYMIPDWMLILNMIIGLIGIFIGIKLINKKIKIKSALIINLPLLFFGFFISYIFRFF